jgi:protein disulfide-isomerase A6
MLIFHTGCGHCKRLAPVFDELAELYKHKTDDLVIAKADCDEHKELGERFSVSGYPTLKWFAKGSTNPEDYEAGRELKDFAEFIHKKACKW